MVTDERKARLQEVIARRLRSVVVVLDGPHDPHNGAAVIRTCDAFGIQHLHVIERYEPFLVAPAVAKGSEEWVDVHTHESTEALVAELARAAAAGSLLDRAAAAGSLTASPNTARSKEGPSNGVPSMENGHPATPPNLSTAHAPACTAHAPACTGHALDAPTSDGSPFELVATSADGELLPSDLRDISQLALVVGNERDGIASDLRRHCRRAVRVPMAGFIDSLNLSVSTAILLYAATFGRLGDLPPEERLRLYARGLYLTVPRAAEVLLAARRQP
jgi:tRNA(Leu) C34 or U34 (ribose-2'-O)-methylase TrmL